MQAAQRAPLVYLSHLGGGSQLQSWQPVPVQFYIFVSWLRAALSGSNASHEGLSDPELETLKGENN